MTPKFTVGIAGGGVAGVTLALALSRFPNIEIDIYEASAKFGEIGAGLAVWYRTWNLLMKLGLQDLEKVVPSVPRDERVHGLDLYKSEGGRSVKFFEMYCQGGMTGVHRAAFHGILAEHLPKTCRIHLSKRLKSYSRNNPSNHSTGGLAAVQMEFEDGTVASCDILVGADGIKSPVRRCLLKEKADILRSQEKVLEADELLKSVDPLWTGAVNYRMTIPLDRLRAVVPADHPILRTSSQWCSKNAHITTYPLHKANLLNISAITSQYDTKEGTKYDGIDVEAVPVQVARDVFANWGPDMQTTLSLADSVTKWAIHVVKPFSSWYLSSIVLVGDAAHAFSPHQGSGAGQAIEDAYILSALLGHELTTLATLPHALEIYQSIRLPFAYDIGARSRQNGRWFSLMDLEHDPTRSEQENLEQLGQMIQSSFEWVWSTSAEDHRIEAIRRLEASLSAIQFAC